MKNSILLVVLALIFSMNLGGCSLFSSGDEEQDTAMVSEDGDMADDGDDFASDDFESGDDTDFDPEAMAKNEGEEKLEDLAGEDVEVEDNFGDEYPDDDYTAEAKKVAENADDFSEDYIDDNSFSEDDDEDDALFVDEGGGIPSDTMTSNQEDELFGKDIEPVVDTPDYSDSGFADNSYMDSVVDEPSSGFISVKKMKPAAYKRAGGNVNRLYVVRSGENMDSVAEKIYGDSSRSTDLYSYNSHFNGKTLNVGDKVYYESPKNKNDQTMKTYYEDNNLAPQYYTSQDGDNIRKAAKKLLGHDRSWMELWATNSNIESKGRLPAGLQIRYWPDGSNTILAMNDPAPAPIVEAEPETVAMDEPADVPDFDESEDMDVEEPAEMAELDDPEPFGDDKDEEFNPPPIVGAVNSNPPPAQPVAPPPPPAPKSNFNKPAPPKVNIGGMNIQDPLAAIGDDSVVMGALGGLLILAAIIMLIFIRRSRAKRVNFSQTQI